MKNDLLTPEKKFRPELEGIRAVAAILVAIYHIWLGKVSGGVDVFFIVSGYLITTSLVTRMVRHGKIDHFENILGLAKRLFPLAFTVLITTAIGVILVFPQSVWQQFSREFIASALYFENWRLALDSMDYLAESNGKSPFQHFWALSLQGQFYITWPILITIVFFLAKRIFKTPVRKTLLGVFILLFVSSISYSIYLTEVNQPFAYFNTFTRVWEFSLGGIVALLIPYLKLPKAVSLPIGWIGLLTILLTGLVLPVSSVFPGYAALLPTMGVIFVILAAENGSRFGAEALLNSAPLQWLGTISYGFYLWHWPLFIFYLFYFNRTEVPILDGLVILIITTVLAYLTIHFVEKPIRKLDIRKSKTKVTGVVASMLIPIVVFSFAWNAYSKDLIEKATKEAEQITENIEQYVEQYPGGRLISGDLTAEDGIDPIPELIALEQDLPGFNLDPECKPGLKSDDTFGICTYGVTDNPDYTIALVGGSHSGHWYPTFEALLEEHRIQLDVIYMDACRLASGDFDGELTPSCMKWNDLVVEHLKETPPDLVVTTANINVQDKVPQEYIDQWEKLDGYTDIFAIRDNPRVLVKPTDCLAREDEYDCSRPRTDVLSDVLPWENTENIPDNVYFADMSDYFCIDGKCPQVIGNVIVYRDFHHISAAYAATLADGLEPMLLEALEQSKQN